MTSRVMRAPLLPLVLLTACPIGNNKYPKPADLSPAWRIDKPRILAVVADPPEIRPGETARFRALITDPNGELGSTAWIACPSDGGGIGFGCAIDPAFDFENASLEALTEAGFIGFEPFLPPVYTAPADALDGLDARASSEGIYVTVTLAALPKDLDPSALAATDSALLGGLDVSAIPVAYKRLVVSDAPSPNHNPEVWGVTVDGTLVPQGTVVEVDPGETYEIGLVLTDDSVESYLYLGPDGVWQQRIEQPYAHWYATGGAVLEEITLDPYLQADWAAPDAAEGVADGTIWAVLRDRRGGMGWVAVPWRLRGARP